jgi:hypothetical protein
LGIQLNTRELKWARPCGEAEEEAGEAREHVGEPLPCVVTRDKVVEEERVSLGGARGERWEGKGAAEVMERVSEDIARGDAADVGAQGQRLQLLLCLRRLEERATAEHHRDRRQDRHGRIWAYAALCGGQGPI